jgi:hypothetical protein
MLIRFHPNVAKLVFLGAATYGLCATLSAQSAQKSEPGKGSVPNFSATWGVARGAKAGYTNPGYSLTNVEPEMTPWAAEQYKKIREGTIPKDPARLKRVGMWDRGRENLDPSEIHCLPWGPTRLFTFDHPIEIVQTAGVVYMLFEGDHAVRRVYVDGRDHGGMYDTYMGHSTGKYEGDALVVDTVAVKDLTWLDTVGHVHSNKLHIVERITRPEPDTLQIDFTIDDPKAYTKPWSGKRVFERLTGSKAEILEYITCQDHLEYDHIPRLLEGKPEIVERIAPPL